MSVRKIGFEITDVWPNQDYRNFIKFLLSDETRYELYIISIESSTDVLRVAGQLGLDSIHTIVCQDTSEKLDAISANRINIHLDSSQRVVDSVDINTDALGVLINNQRNIHYFQMQYVVDFDTALAVLESEDNG